MTLKRKQGGNKKEGKGEQLNGKEKDRGNINKLRRQGGKKRLEKKRENKVGK